MSYVEGESREQQVLFPEALDDYISESNVVRFIDAFVDGLEMEELGFGRAAPKETGRPPYDPRDLLKLYILRLHKPHPNGPDPGTGMPQKCRADVADGQARAGFQDDHGFSQRQSSSV